PKALQYLMGHSDIGVTLNTYTHLGLNDAVKEMERVQKAEDARKEVEGPKKEKPMRRAMFRAI
ncbi:MAG: integrase, partial [Eubacteriales bacterium]|nr:integrase [Eubacteriales bacterium]